MGALKITSNEMPKNFYKLLLILEKSLREYGIKVQARAAAPLYSKLDSTSQKMILDHLNSYIGIIKTTNAKPTDAEFDKKFIWNSFKQHNLKPTDEIFNYYKDGCVVEFYSAQGIQVFRNFNFFSLCSYTLEEVFTQPWFELYDRDPAITEAILAKSEPLFSGKISHAFDPDIDEHYLVEKRSGKNNLIKIKLNTFIPIKSKNSAEIIVAAVEKGDVISATKTSMNNSTIEKETNDEAGPIS